MPYKDPQKKKQKNKERYERNKVQILKQQKENRKNNPEKKKESDRRYYIKNREKITKRNNQWKEDNPEYQKEWFKNHPEYKKKWYKKNHEKERNRVNKQRKTKYYEIRNILNEYKSKPCALCAIQLPPVCMDLHHINPSMKLYNVSSMRCSIVSISRIIKEAEKCIVVCANCHMELNINGYKKFPKWFVEYKSSLKCEMCEINKSLEFHHRDPSTKLFGVSSMVTMPIKFPREIIMNEIKKCRILCRCCHRLEHHWN